MISVIRSGIDAALNDLGVTSNNIANAKTTGFKKRQAT
ncbi:MAG: flagellar basal body protein, partial [Candidatus Puniceispirillaceae bacterium]